MKADTNYGADSSASSTNGFDGKPKLRRRSDYDRSKMDVAVELVLKNKLSLRAASHIYNIPFSSLRTRKILVSKNPQLLKKSKNQNKFNDEDDEFEYEDMENADDFNEEDEELVDDLAVKKENLDIVSSGSKPLTLHAFKKSGMADLKNPKTEAFLAALSNNSKRGSKFSNNRLKIKLNMNKNVSKFASGRITKPTNKRHYLKQDRLQEAVEANGFHDEDSDILDENTNSDNQQSQDEQLQSPNEHEQGQEQLSIKAKSPLTTNTTVTQNPCRSNVSPIKLSSLFSNSVLAMNKKNRRFPLKPNPILRPVSVTQKTTTQNTTQNANPIEKKEDATATSMLDSLQKYLIESKKSHILANETEQADNKSSTLYKCNNCKLIFVDLRLLKEHASSTCDYAIKYEQVETISLRELLTQSLKEKKLFKCSFCNQTYPSKLSLLSHGITCNRKSVNLDVTV